MTQPNNIQTTYGSVFVTQPITSDDQLATKLYVDGSKVSAVSDAKVYTDQEISALVAGAPEALNTLKELADALGSGDLASSITQQLSTVKSDLSVESSARSSKDTELENSIGANLIAINDLTSALTAKESSDSATVAILEDSIALVQSNLEDAGVELEGKFDSVNTKADDNTAAIGDVSTALSNNVTAIGERITNAERETELVYEQVDNVNARIDGTEVLISEKFDKSGGDLSGSVKVPSTHYLYIGNNWRLAAVGNSLEFQYSSTPEVEDTFVHGCPLVFSE